MGHPSRRGKAENGQVLLYVTIRVRPLACCWKAGNSAETEQLDEAAKAAPLIEDISPERDCRLVDDAGMDIITDYNRNTAMLCHY